MRDDIHKRVPRPRKVQRWVQFALREADRLNGRTLGALEDAQREVSRQEISDSFLRGLRRQAESETTDLFGLLGGVQSPRDIGGAGGPVERFILAECQRAVASGRELRDALPDALADALKERARADIRAAEPVLLPTQETEAFKAIEQMKEDVERVNLRAIARERLGLAEREPRAIATVSADEDLLGQRSKGG